MYFPEPHNSLYVMPYKIMSRRIAFSSRGILYPAKFPFKGDPQRC